MDPLQTSEVITLSDEDPDAPLRPYIPPPNLRRGTIARRRRLQKVLRRVYTRIRVWNESATRVLYQYPDEFETSEIPSEVAFPVVPDLMLPYNPHHPSVSAIIQQERTRPTGPFGDPFFVEENPDL